MPLTRACSFYRILPLFIVGLVGVSRLSADLPAPAKDWFPFCVSFDPDTPGILSARSLLHAPAGKDGFVAVRNGHFYTGESRIRFWGVNLCFSANFPEHDSANQLADRLANFGVNCVRFHHMDGAPFPKGIFKDGKLETLSPEALDRMDYLIAALKKRGIYANLNLHVSNSWTRSHHWPDADKLPAQDKMIDLFHPELIAAQKQYARDLLTHLNPYTNTRYCDEPAIAMVEINNENTMFIWDGIRTLAKMPQRYRQILIERFAEWSRDHPQPLPTIFDPTAPRMHWMQFLQSVDESYFTSMRTFLRDELHVKSPITGTIVLGPLGMRSQAKMDFADGHWYWDHPTFPGKAWDSSNWLIHNRPMVDDLERSSVRVAASRIAGRPFTVTEYNHAAPNEYQAECIPFIATYAALQDWDGVFLFAYSHDTNYFKQTISSFFDIEGNPSKMAFLPLGARIFLSGDVAALAGETKFALNFKQSLRLGARYYQDISGYLRDVHQLKPEDYLHSRISSDLSAVSNVTTVPDAHAIHWTAAGPGSGTMSYADAHMAMFVGFPKNQLVQFGPVALQTESAFIAALLLPADRSQTLEQSKRFILCIMGRVSNRDQAWNDSRTSLGRTWGNPPVQMERLRGKLTLRGKQMRIDPIDETGKRTNTAIEQLEDAATCWFELTP